VLFTTAVFIEVIVAQSRILRSVGTVLDDITLAIEIGLMMVARITPDTIFITFLILLPTIFVMTASNIDYIWFDLALNEQLPQTFLTEAESVFIHIQQVIRIISALNFSVIQAVRIVSATESRWNFYVVAHPLSTHIAENFFGINDLSNVITSTARIFGPVKIWLVLKSPLAIMAFNVVVFGLHRNTKAILTRMALAKVGK
jgi:hypothetical protein